MHQPAYLTKRRVFNLVTALNQATFQLATGYRSAGRIVYVYAVPEVDVNRTILPLPFTTVQPLVGFDATRQGMATNVNTLVIENDCRTVVTSNPGLPRGMSLNDPRIHGTAVYTHNQVGPLIP